LQNCLIKWSDLYEEAKLVSHILQVWRDDGLPPGVPMFITESNIASGADESFVEEVPALLPEHPAFALQDVGSSQALRSS